MPTLYGEMPYHPGPMLPCVWCGVPTDTRFDPAGRPELGPLPLHILCGALLLRAYEAFLAGNKLSAPTMLRLQHVQQLQGGPVA